MKWKLKVQKFVVLINKTNMRTFKKFVIFSLLAVVTMVFTQSCNRVKVNAGEEAVLVHKPMFFGKGGVDKTPIPTGSQWTWATTDDVIFKVIPIKYTENLNDVASNENTPLDFNTQIVIQVQKGKTPILLQNYGVDWYKNNIQETYNNYTRNYVSKYSPFDLMSNRDTLALIDSNILKDMRQYVSELSKKAEFPITILSVITGRAIPNDAQLAEMNNTAAQIQAKISEDRRAEKEDARAEAERKRAIADKAYMKELNLTTSEFIQLKQWDVIEKKQGANIDVLVGGAQSMWNVRR